MSDTKNCRNMTCLCCLWCSIKQYFSKKSGHHVEEASAPVASTFVSTEPVENVEASQDELPQEVHTEGPETIPETAKQNADSAGPENLQASLLADDLESGTTLDSDELTQISGIGPVLEKKLHGLGITTFKQIAELDEEKTAMINEQLSFKGRIEREKWVEQAKAMINE
ncbi:MAG: hypothetical protein GKR96_09950 [Gammaproteobacteria bacterium]|nr:hypothetical protein [Gammaproteobacteria bacterium]